MAIAPVIRGVEGELMRHVYGRVHTTLRVDSAEFHVTTFRKSPYRYQTQVQSGKSKVESPLLFGFFFCGSVPAFEFLELAHDALFNAASLPVAPGTPDALNDRARISGPTAADRW